VLIPWNIKYKFGWLWAIDKQKVFMNKLKRREKVILAIAALAVIYAGYVYLISPAMNKAKTTDQRQEISTPASSLKSDLIKDAEAGTQEYIIARAEANWGKNPFVDRSSSSYKEWASIQRAASVSSGSAAKIVYSGYVDAGRQKIAIIDGLEYKTGDQLEMEGYVLKQITPFQVLILNKNTGSEVEIPISE
jgi:hypothetical protein